MKTQHQQAGSRNMSETRETAKFGAVVVGVDGSPGSGEALGWALTEARLRKVPLRAVQAWAYSYAGGTSAGYGNLGFIGSLDSPGAGAGDLERAAKETLEAAIGEAVGETTDVEIERQVVEGQAAAVLISAAAPGDLLVVGSRGHGGFAGLLLGSVSQQCVHHAQCPVVVVRFSKEDAAGHESAPIAGGDSQPVA
jgi:nucleotide-binding universal stress UspA family protein